MVNANKISGASGVAEGWLMSREPTEPAEQMRIAAQLRQLAKLREGDAQINSQISKQKKTPLNDIGRLFVSQSHHGIDTCCAACGEIVGGKSDRSENKQRDPVGQRVDRRYVYQQIRDELRHRYCSYHP